MAGMNYNGVDLTAPAPVKYPTMQAGNIQSYINAFQTGQNQANQANSQRYNQGLGVLTNGATNAQGFGQQAQDQINSIGAAQKQQIANQQQAGLGNVQQSAISRGLNNTTITDALKQGVNQTANFAYNDLADKLAATRAGQYNTQAGLAQQGANSVAGFIGARNDTGPDLSSISRLVEGAASNPGNQRRSGTVINGNPNPQSDFMAGQNRPGSSLGGGGSTGGGGGALGSNSSLYTTPGAMLNGTSGGGAGSFTGSQAGNDSISSYLNDPYSTQPGSSTFFANGSSVTPGGSSGLASGVTKGGNPYQELPASGPTTTTPTQAATPNAVQQPAQKVQISRDMANYNSMLYGPNWVNQFGGRDNVQIV